MKTRDRLEKLHKLASLRETQAKNRQKKFFDQRSKVRELEIGQRVLILLPTSTNKLLAEWKGPYTVLEKVSPVDYKIQMNRKSSKVFHINMLKAYFEREESTGTQEREEAVQCLDFCETQLVQFYHDLVSNLDAAQNSDQKQTDVIIMDFAKAFDKVPHRRLLYKLEYYGIRGSTHKWISSWLSERSQKVVLDGQASDPVPVLSGVPQGSVLGPVLFLIFINDLPENIRSSVRLFADDCVLYRNIKSPIDCQILQDDLNSLAQWETDWQMKFNVAKCHSMRVTRHLPENQIQFEYSLHQQRLEQVQSAKYLGITITDNLDWGQHVTEISCKATKTMGFLRRNLALAPRHTKEVAYKTLVRPQLEYAAPIWHPYHDTQIAQVEKVQRTAARWTCRRWRNTSSVGNMLDELEWPSLEARREQSSLTFFYKIHSGTVSLDKDKYLTPAPNIRSTRATREFQYTRYLAYSDALKNSFFPRTIPVWNSLPSSVVSSKTPEEFKALI